MINSAETAIDEKSIGLTMNPENVSTYFARQVKNLYKGLPMTLYGSILMALIVASVSWKLKQTHLTLYWLGFYSILIFVRGLSYQAYLSSRLNPQDTGVWMLFLVLGCFASGALWSSYAMMFPGAAELGQNGVVLFHSFMVTVIVSLNFWAMMMYSTNVVVFLSFSASSIFPYSLYLCLSQDNAFITMGLVLMLCYCLLFVVCLRQSARINDRLKSDLLTDLE